MFVYQRVPVKTLGFNQHTHCRIVLPNQMIILRIQQKNAEIISCMCHISNLNWCHFTFSAKHLCSKVLYIVVPSGFFLDTAIPCNSWNASVGRYAMEFPMKSSMISESQTLKPQPIVRAKPLHRQFTENTICSIGLILALIEFAKLVQLTSGRAWVLKNVYSLIN